MVKEKSVAIIVATHKRYPMPGDGMYLPLHVGAAGKTDAAGQPLDLGYAKDDVGDNISRRNPGFCELTGLYWAWRNLEADFIGLVHYRRHFSLQRAKDPFASVLTYAQLAPYLSAYRVFLPKKRKYYIETLYSHYAHTHYAEHLDIAGAIIDELYPAYRDTFDAVLKQRSGYMFNMMILERSLLDAYCDWLFPILFELEKRVDATNLSSFQGRLYGRVSEIIFNVWLQYQLKQGIIKKNEIKEIPCIHMEPVNWRKKGVAFLKAKFMGRRYEGSF